MKYKELILESNDPHYCLHCGDHDTEIFTKDLGVLGMYCNDCDRGYSVELKIINVKNKKW